MTDEDFETQKQALIDIDLEKPRSLQEQSQRYWSEIVSQAYAFERKEKEVEEIKKFKKEDLVKFYQVE